VATTAPVDGFSESNVVAESVGRASVTVMAQTVLNARQ